MQPKLTHHEEYLRKKRKRRIIKISAFTIIICFIVGVLSYLSHLDRFRITNVNLFGGVLVTEEEVQQKTHEYLNGSYLLLFPRNNAFIYPKLDLENYLKDSFKRIDTIDISLKNFKRLSVNITERKHFAIWCKGVPEANAQGEECYFMDKNSTIFAPAPDFSGDAYFKYYGYITQDNPIGREYMASSTLFAEISDFVTSVKSANLKPQFVAAKGSNEYILELSSGTSILFDTRESLKKTIDNFALLISSEPFRSMNKSNLPVEYFDLRFGNKLFYKLKT